VSTIFYYAGCVKLKLTEADAVIAVYFLKFDKPERSNVRRIITVFFLPLSVYTYANGNTQSQSGSYFNWITIWLSFFFGLLFTILFRYLNNYSKTVDQRTDAGLPLSGWIMFLGINLIARVIVQAYFFWDADYFLKSTWVHLGQTGGVKYHMLFIFEMFLSLFALAGTGALVYWFFERRDIFPTMFIYYVGFYLVSTCILLILYHNMKLPVDTDSIRQDMFIRIFRIAYGAAWVIFVLRSEKVKQTFVYPAG
jgi:hypothetical protein